MTNNQNHPAMISIDELSAGDILLCYENAKIDPVGKGITKRTDSNYTHAAICIDKTRAAESMVFGGVRKVDILDLIKRYDHLAVFRQPDAWSHASRVQSMNEFIDQLIASGAKYNFRGVAKFVDRRDDHNLTTYEKLDAYFKDPTTDVTEANKRYFCSELVAECFIVSGFIESSAAVVYEPSVMSPGSLGQDPTYGTFFGYISGIPNYSVPGTDEFFKTSTYKDIFGPQ
jgi:hypothetical protein